MAISAYSADSPAQQPASVRRRLQAYFIVYWRGDSLSDGNFLAGMTLDDIRGNDILEGDVLFPLCAARDGAIIVRGRFVFRGTSLAVSVPEFDADIIEPTILPIEVAVALLPAGVETLDLVEHLSGIRRLSRSQGELLEICIGNTEATRHWKPPETTNTDDFEFPPAIRLPNLPRLFHAIAFHKGIVEGAPEPVVAARRERTFQPRHVDFDRVGVESKAIGNLGEEFVVDFERGSLEDAGRSDLAEKVQRVSETLGDGAGYDVLSYSIDGEERFIEVKTTTGGKRTPFFVTLNEVEFSETHADRYRLYRIFSVRNRPRFFVLEGSLRKAVRLEPVHFRACF